MILAAVVNVIAVAGIIALSIAGLYVSPEMLFQIFKMEPRYVICIILAVPVLIEMGISISKVIFKVALDQKFDVLELS